MGLLFRPSAIYYEVPRACCVCAAGPCHEVSAGRQLFDAFPPGPISSQCEGDIRARKNELCFLSHPSLWTFEVDEGRPFLSSFGGLILTFDLRRQLLSFSFAVMASLWTSLGKGALICCLFGPYPKGVGTKKPELRHCKEVFLHFFWKKRIFPCSAFWPLTGRNCGCAQRAFR